jgi:hypothetical protein
MRKDRQIFEIDYRIISLINREAVRQAYGGYYVMIERTKPLIMHASLTKEKFRLMIANLEHKWRR